MTLAQISIGALLLLAAIWGMWTTRELLKLGERKVVSVRLGELVSSFALAEARSGDEPDKVTARTRAFMQALDQALKNRSAAGTTVLVGEAVVSSSTEDITAAIAADVTKLVPMPVAQAMPARLPLPTIPNGAQGGAASGGAGQGGVGQAMLGALAAPAQAAPFQQAGPGPNGAPADYGPSAYQPGPADPSAGEGGFNGQQ